MSEFERPVLEGIHGIHARLDRVEAGLGLEVRVAAIESHLGLDHSSVPR